MAFTPLGFSLPDLTVSALVGSSTAWGGTLGITAVVQNIGANTMTNPIAQAPGALSTADSPASTIAVFVSRRPHSMQGAIQVGSIAVPIVPQNSLETVNDAITMPTRPIGWPRGGNLYVRLLANADGTVVEMNNNNDLSAPVRVRLARNARPSLRAVDLGVPSTIQPGDTIAPTISLENIGNAPSPAPLQVALVASVTPSFTAGSSIVALYDVNTSIPGANLSPGTLGAANLNLPVTASNVYTFTAPPVTLPTSPSRYYLGLVIDPNHQIRDLAPSSRRFQQIRLVGETPSGLPPAGVVSTPNNNPFPLPPSGTFIGIVPTPTPTSTSANGSN